MNSAQISFPKLITLTLAELRGAWKRMPFFILCIAIGVCPVMTIKSFSNMVQETIQAQAKGLWAADIACVACRDDTLRSSLRRHVIVQPRMAAGRREEQK